MLKKLTQRQRETLDYVKRYIAENQYPPSNQEVAETIQISAPGAIRLLSALAVKYYIDYHGSRQIRILKK